MQRTAYTILKHITQPKNYIISEHKSCSPQLLKHITETTTYIILKHSSYSPQPTLYKLLAVLKLQLLNLKL